MRCGTLHLTGNACILRYVMLFWLSNRTSVTLCQIVERSFLGDLVAFEIVEKVIDDFSVVESHLSKLASTDLHDLVDMPLPSGVAVVYRRIVGIFWGRVGNDFGPTQGGTMPVLAQCDASLLVLWRPGMFIEFHGKRPRVAASAFVAPTAVLIGDVEVGEESSIWFGVVLRADNGPIRIGDRTSVQDNAVVHVSHDSRTVIGNDCTVGHSVTMEDCTIENGALIGSNAVVLNGARVGARALIAAGSVVSANATIPPETLSAGVPAAVKRTLEGSSLGWIDATPASYVRLSRSYLQHGIGDPEMQESIETTFAP